MIYKILISATFDQDKKILTYIRKWLGPHSSATNINLIPLAPHCLLQVKKFAAVFKSSKLSGYLLLRDSQDPWTTSSCTKLKSGQWDEEFSVKTSET